MIRKQTWILLIIFLLLAGAAYYLQKNPNIKLVAPTPSATQEPAVLPGWNNGDIARIEYKDSQGMQIQLQQDSSGAWMLQPDAKTVDVGKIEQIRTQILDLRTIASLDTGLNLDVMGLSQPSGIFILTNTQAKQVKIQIGKATPTGTGYYVRIDQNPPIVISKGAVDALLDLFKKEALLDLTPTPAPVETLQATATP
jgi:hypothetical protein